MLQRHSERMDSYPALQERVEALRALYRTTAPITRLGEHTSSGQTPPGGVSLSAGYKPPSPESLTGTTAQPAA